MNEVILPSRQSRTVYFDYLRVMATFIVMLLHTGAQNWNSSDVHSNTFAVFSFYVGIARWGVPVFVMISGALFLSRENSISRILKHNFLRMVTAYFGWGFIYFLFAGDSVKNQLVSLFQAGKGDQIIVILNSHFHLWFIPVIAGIYLCIPVLEHIVKNDKIAKYFLLLVLLFTFALPEVQYFADNFLSSRYAQLFDAFYGNISKLSMGFASGYCGYFILGYFLSRINFNRMQREKILLLGAFGFLATIILTLLASFHAERPVKDFLNNFTVNVLMEAIGIVILFRNIHFPADTYLYSIIIKMSRWSFGAYLVHLLLLEKLKACGLTTLSFCPVLSVPVISAIVFLGSFAISAMLNQIPIVNKYLV